MSNKRIEAAQWFIKNIGEHPKRLVLISVGILTTGFLWKLAAIIAAPSSDTIAFSRSGALLVVFAIATVFFNHVLTTILENTKISNEKISWLSKWPKDTVKAHLQRQTQDHITKHLLENTLRHNPDFWEESSNSLIQQGREIADANEEKIKRLSAAQTNLGYTEAMAGIAGTLVWGYGDLIFIFLWNAALFLAKIPPYLFTIFS